MIKILENLFNRKPIINVIKLPHAEDLALPFYAHSGDSGVDLRAALREPMGILPGESEIVPTGLCFELPKNYEFQIRSRSGLAAKYNIFVLNGVGTCDNSYRGEIKVILFNLGRVPFIINHGDRIAQGVINRVEQARLIKRSVLKSTERGSGGFGSTGQN